MGRDKAPIRFSGCLYLQGVDAFGSGQPAGSINLASAIENTDVCSVSEVRKSFLPNKS
jgi:hypothetical protein